MVSGNTMSGKSSLTRLLTQDPKVVLLNETYTEPNRFLPLFIHKMLRNGLKYNEFAYGAQLLFLQNRSNREREVTDPGEFYLLDRSIYEDRHIFAKFFAMKGVMSNDEYNDYRNLFEKIVRTIDPPDCFIFLDSDPKQCYQRLKSRSKRIDQWLTQDILVDLDKLYKHRLRERIVLHNSDVQIIELDVDKYPSFEVAGEIVRERLEELYGEAFAKDASKRQIKV